MDKRVQFLDQEGLLVSLLSDAGPAMGGTSQQCRTGCRALSGVYTWTLDVCAGHRERLYPVGHISLRHPQAAVRELERLAKAGVRTVFVGALPSTARASAALTSIR